MVSPVHNTKLGRSRATSVNICCAVGGIGTPRPTDLLSPPSTKVKCPSCCGEIVKRAAGVGKGKSGRELSARPATGKSRIQSNSTLQLIRIDVFPCFCALTSCVPGCLRWIPLIAPEKVARVQCLLEAKELCVAVVEKVVCPAIVSVPSHPRDLHLILGAVQTGKRLL